MSPRTTLPPPATGKKWTTFREIKDWRNVFDGNTPIVQLLHGSSSERDRINAHLRSGHCFENNLFVVIVIEMAMPMGPTGIHLLIMPRDNRPDGSWSDLQRIKNEVVGSEIEMYQVHPPERETVDEAHTYHLWGYRDATWRLPLGLDRPLHFFARHDFRTTDGMQVQGLMYLPTPESSTEE